MRSSARVRRADLRLRILAQTNQTRMKVIGGSVNDKTRRMVRISATDVDVAIAMTSSPAAKKSTSKNMNPAHPNAVLNGCGSSWSRIVGVQLAPNQAEMQSYEHGNHRRQREDMEAVHPRKRSSSKVYSPQSRSAKFNKSLPRQWFPLKARPCGQLQLS